MDTAGPLHVTCTTNMAARDTILVTGSPSGAMLQAGNAAGYNAGDQGDSAADTCIKTYGSHGAGVTKKRTTGKAAAPELRLQDTLRLSADGLGKVLGDLEVRVMRAVWGLRRPATARHVHERVVLKHDVQLLTVITVLNRLVDKGLLARAKRDDVFHYEALWSETDLTAHASRRAVEGVLSFGPEVVAASFVDVLAERDPDQLADLARLIRARMRQDSREDSSDSSDSRGGKPGSNADTTKASSAKSSPPRRAPAT